MMMVRLSAQKMVLHHYICEILEQCSKKIELLKGAYDS